MTFPMPMVAPFHEAGLPASIEFVQSLVHGSILGDTTYNASINVGDAAIDRVVFIAVSWNATSTGPQTIASATIGGVSASVLVTQSGAGGTYNFGVAILAAVVPSGATAAVAVTFTGTNVNFVQIASFRGLNISSLTPVDTDGTLQAAGVRTLSIDTVTDGILIAANFHNGTSTITWGGVTSRFAYAVSTFYTQGASNNVALGENGKALTLTRTAGTDLSTWGVAVAASLR